MGAAWQRAMVSSPGLPCSPPGWRSFVSLDLTTEVVGLLDNQVTLPISSRQLTEGKEIATDGKYAISYQLSAISRLAGEVRGGAALGRTLVPRTSHLAAPTTASP